MDALVAALDDPDGFLRYKAIAAIEKIRRDHPAISCPRAVLESQVVRESSRYYNGLTLQHNLLRHAPDAADSLLSRALQDKLHRTIDRIYRLLGLLYHVDDVAAARYTIEQGQGASPRGGGRVSRQSARWRRAQTRDADPGRLAADRKGPLRQRGPEKPPTRSGGHARTARARGRSGGCRCRRFISSASAASGG